MERQFPDEFPFASRPDADTAAPQETEVTRLETPPPAAATCEVVEVLSEADVIDAPEAEEIFDVPEEAVAARPMDEEAPLASPGLTSAARELVTPLLAPLGVVSAVPPIVEQALPPAPVDAKAEYVPSCPARADRGPERRRTPRQPLRAKASFRAEADVTAQRTVRIVNLSLKGVRFWSGQSMTAGDRGDVRMEAGPVKWSSRVRVVSCQPQGEGYEIGCEFVANEIGPRKANLVNPLVWAPVKSTDRAETQAA